MCKSKSNYKYINYLEKKEINIDSFKEVKKEFIKNRLILWKTIFFAEEINKIALSSNDDKRLQSIDLVETCRWNEQRSYMERRKN